MEFTDYAHAMAIRVVTGKELQTSEEIDDFFNSLEEQLQKGQITKEDVKKIQILIYKYLHNSDFQVEFEKKFPQDQDEKEYSLEDMIRYCPKLGESEKIDDSGNEDD